MRHDTGDDFDGSLRTASCSDRFYCIEKTPSSRGAKRRGDLFRENKGIRNSRNHGLAPGSPGHGKEHGVTQKPALVAASIRRQKENQEEGIKNWKEERRKALGPTSFEAPGFSSLQRIGKKFN